MLTAQLQEKLRVPGLAISILYNLEELSSCFLIDKKEKKKKDWLKSIIKLLWLIELA